MKRIHQLKEKKVTMMKVRTRVVAQKVNILLIWNNLKVALKETKNQDQILMKKFSRADHKSLLGREILSFLEEWDRIPL